MAWLERPGVILGMDRDTDIETAARISDALSERFPGVAFAVVPGVVTTAVFPWFEEVDDDPVRRE